MVEKLWITLHLVRIKKKKNSEFRPPRAENTQLSSFSIDRLGLFCKKIFIFPGIRKKIEK